jgi:hypothetical protein
MTTFIQDKYAILATVEPQLESPLTEPANARLIAAAPELLEALETLIQDLQGYSANTLDERTKSKLSEACALIIKATGGGE